MFLSVTLFSTSSVSPKTQTNETLIAKAYLNFWLVQLINSPYAIFVFVAKGDQQYSVG